MPVNITNVELGTVMTQALSFVLSLADEKQISIDSGQVDSCHVEVKADAVRFKQVLINLLSNAIKYNRDAGSVTLSCESVSETRVRINVADTGPGIPESERHLIFQPFERLNADNTQVEGTGIGLALCKRLVEAMRGEIDFQSVPGEGSTFWVELNKG
jgi:signal transduction histidine kinase